MFEDGHGDRPLFVTFLYLFYAAASVGAAVIVATLVAGAEMPMLPSGMDAPGLAAEILVFAFMAYGLRRGWTSAWLVALVMNVLWIFLDSRSLLAGNTGSVVPIAIAVASLAVLFSGSSRSYFRITRGGTHTD